MSLEIPADVLKQAGLTEQEARIEIACRLFQADRLHLWPAAKFAGLGRIEFEEELHKRGIPIFKPTLEDIRADIEALKRIGA